MLKDKRLRLLSALTPACNVAADIGTDHGYLGCELLESEKCREVWFTDISPGALAKAQRLAAQKGLEENARFYLGDGAQPLPGAPDAAIISGMGGHTICHILSLGEDKLRGSKLILGANTALKQLRLWLMQNHYTITDEAAVQEADKFYVILCAQDGKMELGEDELTAGPILMKRKDEETKEYFRYRLNGARIALERACVSENADTKNLREEMERWQKLL